MGIIDNGEYFLDVYWIYFKDDFKETEVHHGH